MPVDFAALARSVVDVPGVQACLLLSRDGLPLAAAPPTEEDRVMAAWARLGALGDVEKGFVAVDGQTWVFSRRGPFCAMAMAERTVRPGLVLAELDQVLLSAEEDRTRGREEIRTTASRPQPDPTSRPRFQAPLHRDRDRAAGIPAEAGAPSVPAPAVAAEAPAAEPDQGVPHISHPSSEVSPSPPPEPRSLGTEDWEIDVVEISREFGGLYGGSPEDEMGE
jgi:hypothetical protein